MNLEDAQVAGEGAPDRAAGRRRVPVPERHGKKLLLREPVEGVVIPERLAPRPGASDPMLYRPLRRGEVADVEDRELDGAVVPVGRVRRDVDADGEQVRVVERLQIGREPGQLEHAGAARIRWIAEVEGEQRIDRAERHHEASVAEKARPGDPFAGGKLD